MIIYFADREMQILGHATTNLPDGFVITEDLKTEEIETGVASFDCRIGFNDENRALLEEMTEAGNYLLRSNDGENEFYTIIETEIDTKNQDIYVYAEDAGLDLLNEIAPEFENETSYTAEWYINKYIVDSGFEIGVNEIPSSSKRALSWDGEATVTERLVSIANSFGGYEVSYSFDIKGLEITNKYVNIHQERGKELGEHLRLNRDIDRILTTKSVANLATAFVCEGGTPEGADNPITLKGYKYDDGDFYVDGDKVKSRNANKKWSRYVWNKEPNRLNDGEGYIVRPYSYDTLKQSELCSHAITELKKVCDMEVNYEIDIGKLPDGVKIGDRINIVDDAGELYVSSRILKLETSVTEQTHAATLGEHLIKKSGISQKVIELAEQFAQTAKSAEKALSIANTAKSNAQSALTQANEVAEEVEKAQQSANTAAESAANALQSATNAQTAADEAKNAVDNVEKSVENLETTVNNAQTAANNAQQAATTAQTKATEAEQAAIQAKADAADAKASVEIAEEKANTAISKADTAINTADTAKTEANTAKETAEAAKLDAKKAEEDIASLGERLETVTTTMEANYARKTDLTESEAHLQSQISQNAGLISSTVSMLSVIDETANNAQDQSEKAQKRAEEAQRQADQATADALAAQEAADDAAQSAANAQAEADTARAAAETAQSVVDQAEAELNSAKADLDEVLSRADATEAEIAAAQNAVNTAQAAADKAKADASVAIKNATEAQNVANEAKKNADEAQATANTAAQYAKIAQSVANEAENATAAQDRADEAASIAAQAKETADTAVTDAADAKAKADQAVADAIKAENEAKAAAQSVANTQANLNTAKQNLADILANASATQEDIAEAQEALEIAQANADEAMRNAAVANGAAELAAELAAVAQGRADEAKAKADEAQKAADDAQTKADEAKAAAESLAVRVTKAETSITQNSEAIELRATKTEVVDYINKVEVGGRNLLLNSSFEENADGWGGAESIGDITETVTGTGAVALNDFQTISNNVEVKLSSDTITDFSGVTVNAYGKNLITTKKEYVDSVKSIYLNTTAYWRDFTTLPAGTYTLSIVCADGGVASLQVTNSKYANIANAVNTNNLTFKLTETTVIMLKATATRFTSIDDIVSAQLELGTTATDYEPYIEPSTYTSNADGTVKGVTAVSPNMTIMADSSVNISATYIAAKGFTEKYGRQCAHIHQSELQTTKYVAQSVLGKLEPNTEYTMSGWGLTENIVPGTTSFSIMFYHSGYYDNNGVSTWFGYGNKGFVVNAGSGEWVHLVWTFKTDDKVNTATETNVFVNTKDFTGDVYFCDLKLEKGNKATDWTPAPEDVAEDIGAVGAAANDINSRLLQAEATIKVLSEAITQMVRKNGDSSVMIQEEDSATWYFDVGNIEENAAANAEAIGALQDETNENKSELEKLKDQVAGYEERFTVSVYEDEPCIILHETDSDRVQIITNTRRIFARKVETAIPQYTTVAETDLSAGNSITFEPITEWVVTTSLMLEYIVFIFADGTHWNSAFSPNELGGVAKYIKAECKDGVCTFYYYDDEAMTSLWYVHTTEGWNKPLVGVGPDDDDIHIKVEAIETGEVEVNYVDLKVSDYETLRSKKAEHDESVKVGGWVWQTRNNGKNFGLVWKGVDG